MRLSLRIVKFTAVCGLLASGFVFTNAQARLSDPNDQALVRTPIANSVVRGVSEIKFRVFDNNRNFVPTRIEILDQACVAKQRTILNANLASGQQDQIRGWNSAAGYTDGGALADGNYCFSLCTEMLNGQQAYSTCQRRRVVLRNRPNNPPRVTSTPRTSITQAESYLYVLTASDLDGDSLTYRAVQKPDWLSFTGNRLSGSNAPVGSFQLVLEVTDGYGGLARQTYTLNVSARVEQPTPPPSQTPDPGEQPVEVKPIALEFIYPLADSVLGASDNLVEWKLENAEAHKPESLTLEYRKATDPTWQQLKQFNASELLATKSFNWDVSKLKSERYRLRLRLDLTGDNIEATSAEFEIRNQGEPPAVDPEIITITNLIPENGAALTELKDNKIGAQISIDGAKIKELKQEQIKLKVNDQEQDDCDLQKLDEKNYKLSCKLKEVKVGEYKVVIEVPEHKAKREWAFAIVEKKAETQALNWQDYTPLALAAGVILCLLLLPLVLLAIVRRRRDKYYLPASTATTTTVEADDIPLGDPFARTNKTTTQVTATKSAISPVVPVVAATGAVAAASTQAKPSLKDRLKATAQKVQQAVSKVLADLKQRLPKRQAKTTTTVQTETTKAEATPLAAAKEPTKQSTAAILEGNNFSLTDSYAGDNPLAPVAKQEAKPAAAEPVVSPVTASASASSTSQSEPAPTASPAKPSMQAPQVAAVPATAPADKDDDLPDWLKADTATAATLPGPDDALEKQQQKPQKANNDDDDGSDPYGFGEYSLGDPN